MFSQRIFRTLSALLPFLLIGIILLGMLASYVAVKQKEQALILATATPDELAKNGVVALGGTDETEEETFLAQAEIDKAVLGEQTLLAAGLSILGTVRDSNTGAAIVGAGVTCGACTTKAATNTAYGFQLAVPKSGTYYISVGHINYNPKNGIPVTVGSNNLSISVSLVKKAVPTKIPTKAPTRVPTRIPTKAPIKQLPTAKPASTFTITGKIINASGVAISGATVRITSATVTIPSTINRSRITSYGGFYSWSGMKKGNYQLQASAPNYKTSDYKWADLNTGTKTVNFTLSKTSSTGSSKSPTIAPKKSLTPTKKPSSTVGSKTYTITGKVFSPVGDGAGGNTPLQGVTASLVGQNKGAGSNSNGTYSFIQVKPGNYTITLRKSCYIQSNISVTVGSTNVTVPNVTMTKDNKSGGCVSASNPTGTPFRISGRVDDQANSNKPLSGATVSWVRTYASTQKSPAADSGRITTGATGSFYFVLSPGVYTVTASKITDKERCGSQSTTIAIGPSVSQNFKLSCDGKTVPTVYPTSANRTWKISGYVSYGSKPLLGALVRVEEANRNSNANQFGYYSVSTLKNGTYTVTASANGYVTKTVKNVKIYLGDLQLNFSLQKKPIPSQPTQKPKLTTPTPAVPKVNLTVQIVRTVDGSERPVPGARVEVKADGKGSQTTNDAGIAVFPVWSNTTVSVHVLASVVGTKAFTGVKIGTTDRTYKANVSSGSPSQGSSQTSPPKTPTPKLAIDLNKLKNYKVNIYIFGRTSTGIKRITNAKIYLYSKNGTLIQGPLTQNSLGRYTFSGVLRGDYYVRVITSSYLPRKLDTFSVTNSDRSFSTILSIASKLTLPPTRTPTPPTTRIFQDGTLPNPGGSL